jgi:DNA-binding HxlR family transcriptional regulator
MQYGQFCPIAKATEVLGERWTLLVVRELLAGAKRYTELKRALGRISPSVLSGRIKSLCEQGVVERVEGAPTPEYRLTAAGAELAPIVEGIGVWGQRWLRSRMTRDELDVELLMLHLARQLDTSAFPQKHAVLAFVFSDLHGALRRFWLLVDGEHTELCATPPGRTADLTVTATVRALTEAFLGDTTVRAAIASGDLVVQGEPKLTRSIGRWLKPSAFATVPRAQTPD